MKNVQTDRFHQIFPDHGEPKLPISSYNKLLDTMEEDAAFSLLCDYERGSVSLSDVTCHLAADGGN